MQTNLECMSLPLGGTETQHVALRTKQGDTTLCQYTAETVEKRARESEEREVQRKEWAISVQTCDGVQEYLLYSSKMKVSVRLSQRMEGKKKNS